MLEQIHEETIGQMPDGRDIKAFTLGNEKGLRATFLNYGGILVELEVPDKIGMPDDITLGLDSIEDYVENNPPYFGALVGRYANRIAHGKFKLDGREYQLPLNEPHGHLHGGPEGFSNRIWESEIRDGENGQVLVLSIESPDGEMGYPGNLKLEVEISITEENGVRFDYTATTDKPTIVNFTNHSYFNLTGQDAGSIRQHIVKIEADTYLPIMDDTCTPTGAFEIVSDGPFDFREPAPLDHRLDSPNAQVALSGGFDHNFVLREDRDVNEPVATVVDEISGRRMEVLTSEPGLQFYTGNFLDETLAGKNGYFYPKHAGFCMETQHYPDSPNFEEFPSTRLDPGETFKSFTEYRFSAV
jgi:aldose 1-epimerase